MPRVHTGRASAPFPGVLPDPAFPRDQRAREDQLQPDQQGNGQPRPLSQGR